MLFVLKRLSLGLFLIFLTSAILLVSDWKQRRPRSQTVTSASPSAPVIHPPAIKWKISLIELIEGAPMEEALSGARAGFKQSGLIDGKDFDLKIRNAQGDMATLNALVDAAITEQSDLIFTITTPALQAAVNKIKDRPVIFTLAVDPLSWGAGRSYEDHLPNVTGVFVNSPFAEMLKVIRQMLPGTRRIGTLFSPSEANSVYIKGLFEQAVQKAGLELVAVPVTSSPEVADAAMTLCSQGIQAICQIGDNISTAGFASIARAAGRSKIPLFCFSTFQVREGAVVAVANDHFDSGRESALIAARVMRGESPADIPYQPAKTVKIAVNTEVARAINIRIPPDLMQRADEIIGKDGKVTTRQRNGASGPLSKKWNIHLIEYTNVLDVEDSRKGIQDGLREAGLVEGKDFDLRIRNAQGDMAALTGMVDAAVGENADMLMTMSTPTLQAAIKRGRGLPIVFTLVASAVAAGAGTSGENHLPNVTGVETTSAYRELVALLKECLPAARRIGTLFVPSETNSVYNKEQVSKAAGEFGMELIVVGANTSGDVADAALSLCSKQLDAVCQIAGNLTASSFPSIVRAANRNRLPVFAFQSNQAHDGAALVVARDYYDGGREAAFIAARVMRGENPDRIPFQPLQTTRIIINKKAVQDSGLVLPDSVWKRAKVIE